MSNWNIFFAAWLLFGGVMTWAVFHALELGLIPIDDDTRSRMARATPTKMAFFQILMTLIFPLFFLYVTLKKRKAK